MEEVLMAEGAPARTIRFTVALRRSLRGEHERLERRLGLPASIVDSADYSRLLSLWSIVWDSVAAKAAGSELAVVAGDALAALALDRGEPEPCQQIQETPFELPGDEASIWGATYVLRGSSLGNQFLHPLILGRLGGGSEVSTHYLAGHGTEVRRDWSAFCHRLDHWAGLAAQTDRDRAAASAANTFRFVGAVADATGWPAGP
jgi:heme oxygenase